MYLGLCVSHEPLGMNPRGLSLPLHARLNVSRQATERDNRHHDGCPSNVDGGIDVSVHRCRAGDALKAGLTLAVLFGTVAAGTTRSRRVARVYRVQGDTSKRGLVGEKETQLPEGPGGMASALRVSNRAFGS